MCVVNKVVICCKWRYRTYLDIKTYGFVKKCLVYKVNVLILTRLLSILAQITFFTVEKQKLLKLVEVNNRQVALWRKNALFILHRLHGATGTVGFDYTCKFGRYTLISINQLPFAIIFFRCFLPTCKFGRNTVISINQLPFAIIFFRCFLPPKCRSLFLRELQSTLQMSQCLLYTTLFTFKPPFKIVI
jgi:hypothetical protein